MKKKIISLILCVVAICAMLTGCGRNAERVINKALKNTRNQDSMIAEMNLELSTEMNGEAITVPLTVYIAAKDLKTEKPISYTTAIMNVMEQQVKMEVYKEGSDGYVVIEDTKYKTQIPEDNSSYDYRDDIDDIVRDIPKELLKDVETVKGEDGSSSVELKLKGEKFSEIYKDFIESIAEEVGTTDDSEIEISNAVVKVTVKDKHISMYDMQFDMNITSEDTTVKTGVRANISYDKLGKEISITPPQDYKSFEEINPN